MTEHPPITTPRLRLVSLSVELFKLLFEDRTEEAVRAAGFAIPPSTALAEQSWVKRRLEMIAEDPEQHPWMNRAIVRREDNQMVGNISFHHKAPDPHLSAYADEAAELGYTIEEPFRRNGYATESARAMMDWAHREHGVNSFFVSISPGNAPSRRMAEAMGFRKVGEHIDDIDGLEWVMRRELRDEATQTDRD